MNEYYSDSGYPSTGAAPASAPMRAELASVSDGFDKLPALTGNGGKIIAVNAGGTAQEALTTTGTGSAVRATSPTLETPILGTPTSGTLTNCTGLPAAGVTGTALVASAIGSTVQAYDADLTTWAGVTQGTGVTTFLATPSSANLAAAVTGETGTGALVFATSPTLVTPALGTPSSGVATNLTGTAAGLTAGTVTTNANLSGHVTSVGNTTSLGSFTVAQLNTAISDADVATGGGTATGTNTGDQTATTVANTPAGSIAATTVQAAINELDTEKAAIAGSASQAFSVAAATAADHAVRLDQFQGWATFSPSISAEAGTWGTPTVATARKMQIGKILHLSIKLAAQVATGSPAQLHVLLPDSLSCPTYTRVPVVLYNAGVVVGQCIIGNSGTETYLTFMLINSATFNGAEATQVHFQGSIEVS